MQDYTQVKQFSSCGLSLTDICETVLQLYSPKSPLYPISDTTFINILI